MLSYDHTSMTNITVRLDGRIAGHIRKVEGGYAYYPKGKTYPGDTLPTVNAIKKTLESDNG